MQKTFNRAVSVFTLLCFFLSCVFAYPLQASSPVTSEDIINEITSVISKNSSAEVTETYIANGDKVLVFIQDLHCNPAVQKNICDVISSLNSKFNVEKVIIEGAPFGKIQNNIISTLPQDTSAAAADYLLNIGYLSGAELFLKDNFDIAYGIEDWDLYFSNVANAYRLNDVYNKNSENIKSFKKLILKDISKKLEGKYSAINKFLLNPDVKFNDIYDLSIESAYPVKQSELAKEIYSSETLENLNAGKIKKQLQTCILKLRETLSYKDYKDLNDNSGSVNFFYGKLNEIFNDKRYDFANQYPDLAAFLETSAKRSAINHFDSFWQFNKYIEDLIENDYGNLSARELLTISKMTSMLENYFSLNLTPQNWRYFSLNLGRYKALLKKYYGGYDGLRLLDDDSFKDYYDINIKRDEVFLKNALKHLKNSKSNSLNVFVAGGFHTDFLKKLADNKMSYVVVTPALKAIEAQSLYSTRLNADYSSDALSLVPIMLADIIPDAVLRETYFDRLLEAIISANAENVPPQKLKEIIEDWVKKLSEENKAVPENYFTAEIENGKFIIRTESSNREIILQLRNNRVVFDEFAANHMNMPKYFRIIRNNRLRLSFFSFIDKHLKSNLAQNAVKRFGEKNVTQGNSMGFPVTVDGKKILVYVDNKIAGQWLNTEMMREMLDKAVDNAKMLLPEKNPAALLKSAINITIVKKSSHFFENHFRNGFINVNSGISKVEKRDKDVAHAFIFAGIIHELTHEMVGNFSEAEQSQKDIYNMLYYLKIKRGVKDTPTAIERIKNALDGILDDNAAFFEDLDTYSNFDSARNQLTEGIFRNNGALMPPDNDEIRAIAKAYLTYPGHTSDQRKANEDILFANLLLEKNEKPSKPFDSIVRIEELKETLEGFRLEILGTKTFPDADFFIKFEEYFVEALQKLHSSVPTYLFERYYKNRAVILNHDFDHSFTVYKYIIEILSKDPSFAKRTDPKYLAYAVVMHDISTLITRSRHEENSAAWVDAIFKRFPDKNIDEQKLKEICLGHKKIENTKIPRDEHNAHPEARLLHDADAFAAIFEIDRIFDIWISDEQSILFNENISISQRTQLLIDHKYTAEEGGDGINDLIRQTVYRRNPDLFLTAGAREIIGDSTSDVETLKAFIQMKLNAANAKVLKDKLKLKNPENAYNVEDIMVRINDVIDRTVQALKERVAVTVRHQVRTDFFNLIKFITKYLFAKGRLPKVIILSDIHGGAQRLKELLAHALDIDEKQIDLENNLVNFKNILSNKAKQDNFKIIFLGDLLDRGPEQIAAWEIIQAVIDSGSGVAVTGNHDLYAFMNVAAVHLPYYEGYNGIPKNYQTVDLEDEEITYGYRNPVEDLAERQTSKNEDIAQEATSQIIWAKKLAQYMENADKRQKEHTKTLKEIIDMFNKMYNLEENENAKIDNINFSKEKDILNNPSGIFAKEENVYLLNWWKKIIGHDVGVWVYTGFKAADKMSINWWIDRKVELDVIKNKYPHHHEEWKKMEALIDEVISSQKEKMRQELKKGNWQWAILDAIMYLNYQSTEWNALDWVYHKDWGSVTGDGFLAQRNKELVGETIYETNEKYKHLSGFVSKTIIEALTKNPGISLAELASILKEKNSIPEDNALTKLFNEFCSDNNSLNLIVGRLAGDKEHNYENGRLLNNSNYLSDYKIRALGEFYKNNFALHVKDMFGFSYMHSLLPVNDDGVVSIGTRGGGLRYKGEYYPPEKILEGLEKISLDIRNFQLGQDNISQIMEALNLITSIYSDVSTKIKPKDIAFQKKTGFGKIFNPLKILLLFAGHNPFDKLKKEKIGTTESDDNNMIRLINADHGISPKYGNMGSLFVVDPAKGVYSYGFEDSVSETIIEKNMVSKDSLDALLRISAEYNLFDFLRSRFGFFKIELEKTIRKAEKRRQQKTLKNNVFLFVPSLEKTLSSENFSENFMDADDLTRKKGKSFVIAFEDRITKDILPSQSRLIQKTTMDINGELETADIMLNSYGKTNVILIKTDKILDSRLKKQFLLNAVLPIINEDSALKDIVNKKGKRVFVKLEEDISSGEISFDESKLFGMSFVIPAEYASAAVKKVYDASAYGFIKGFAGSVFVEFTRAAKPDVENILRKQVPATIHSADILRAA